MYYPHFKEVQRVKGETCSTVSLCDTVMMMREWDSALLLSDLLVTQMHSQNGEKEIRHNKKCCNRATYGRSATRPLLLVTPST